MLTGVKDIDTIILNKLNDHDLVRVCQTSKYVDRLCKDQMFWLNRILHKYPYLPLEVINKYKGDRSWSQYYINDLRKININNSAKYLYNGSINGRLDHVILAINNGANVHASDDIAIRWAMQNGHIDILKYLVEAGANIHTNDDFIFSTASIRGNIDILKYLVEKGVNIHTIDNAIRLAIQSGHSEVVKYLKSLL